jgi:hypothetical protein
MADFLNINVLKDQINPVVSTHSNQKFGILKLSLFAYIQ